MAPNESEYLRKVGPIHRKEYGQFFTHPEIARFMVKWVLGSGQRTLFDPAFGLGAFLNAARSQATVKFAGSEIDPEVLKYWQCTALENGVEITNENYLLSWGKTHTNIVCNPPYMRFQKFSNRIEIFRAFTENYKLRLSGYTNTASAFLVKSISELDGQGRLAYIMPLEFMNAGYGAVVKTRLIEEGHLAAVIRLNCEKDVFPDSVTSVGILLYDASSRHSHVDFFSASSIDSLSTILDTSPVARLPVSKLDPKAKWLCHFQSQPISVNRLDTVPLKHYGRFSRGIATGANDFFVLKPSRAKLLGLEPVEFLPCITRSAQVRKLIFANNDYEKLVGMDAPVLIFNAGSEHSEHARAYIHAGERLGYNRRFLTKNRHPWHRLETRQSAPLLIGVFSRGGYKVVRNRSKVLNLTCFHGFHPSLFGVEYIDHLFLYLISLPGREIVSMSFRRYGDALDKFEPNDLNEALVPSPRFFSSFSTKEVADAIAQVEESGSLPSSMDSAFGRLRAAA